MRQTAKYTLVTGFGFSGLALTVLRTFGTDFTTLTAVLYLYGFVCLLGGLIGYRHARLLHAEKPERPKMRHIAGLQYLTRFFSNDEFEVRIEEETLRAQSIRMNEDLVSLTLSDGTKISYPRQMVGSLQKDASSLSSLLPKTV